MEENNISLIKNGGVRKDKKTPTNAYFSILSYLFSFKKKVYSNSQYFGSTHHMPSTVWHESAHWILTSLYSNITIIPISQMRWLRHRGHTAQVQSWGLDPSCLAPESEPLIPVTNMLVKRSGCFKIRMCSRACSDSEVSPLFRAWSAPP